METGIEVKTRFFPLAWILLFVAPRIVINGESHKKRWGKSKFELSPGEYTVKIYFPYFIWSECGANEVSFSLSQGQQKKVYFYMPPWMLAKGKMKVEELSSNIDI